MTRTTQKNRHGHLRREASRRLEAPGLSLGVEYVAPTAQQREEMTQSLHILAGWLIRARTGHNPSGKPPESP